MYDRADRLLAFFLVVWIVANTLFSVAHFETFLEALGFTFMMSALGLIWLIAHVEKRWHR